jgi:hypothetical protein
LDAWLWTLPDNTAIKTEDITWILLLVSIFEVVFVSIINYCLGMTPYMNGGWAGGRLPRLDIKKTRHGTLLMTTSDFTEEK